MHLEIRSRKPSCTVTTALLAAFLVAPATGRAQPASDASRREATQKVVKEILLDLWATPLNKVKSQGSSALRRARGARAELVDVEFAYALLLCQHGEWESAVNVLKRVVDSRPNYSPGCVGLTTSLARSGKIDAGLAALRDAATFDPKDRLTIQAVAAAVTFLSEFPPDRLKRGSLQQLQDALVPKLKGSDLSLYRDAAEETRRYIESLPALKEEQMGPVRKMQEEMVQLAETSRQLESEQQALKRDGDILAANIQSLNLSANRASASWNRQIRDAERAKDEALSRRLRSRRDSELRQIQSAIDSDTLEYRRLEQEYAARTKAIQAIVVQHKQLEARAAEAEARIDQMLKTPPLPFDPVKERDRILAGGALPSSSPESKSPTNAGPGDELADAPSNPASEGSANPPGDPPVNAADDRKAKGVLGLAQTLHKAGRLDKAADYYRRVVKEYPDTSSAAEAAKALEEVAKEQAEPSPSPK